jgi:hypothetical protein
MIDSIAHVARERDGHGGGKACKLFPSSDSLRGSLGFVYQGRGAGSRVLTAVFLSFVVSLALPTAARAQTVVQHGIKEATTSSLKLSLPFGSNTTAGDTAVATFAIVSGTQTGTVTDSLGTACHQGPHIDSASAPGMDLEQWYCPNLAGGADTVTVKISGAVQRAVTMEIVELTGVLQSASVLDQTATKKNASSKTAVTGTTATTTSAPEIAIGAVGFDYAKTLSTGPANGSSLDNESTTAPTLFTADQIVDSTGTLNNSWTVTTANASLGLIGTYVITKSVTNVLTHQGGGQFSCGTTGNLPSGTWSQVSADNAGQPCAYKNNEGDVYGTGLVGNSNDTCDSTANWNYNVQGHVTFGPPSGGTPATSLQIQVYIGSQGGGAICSGGNIVTCAPSYKLVESTTIAVTEYNESFRFSALELGLAPSYSTPGDGNFQAFYVFAEPVGGTVQCTDNIYATTEHN